MTEMAGSAVTGRHSLDSELVSLSAFEFQDRVWKTLMPREGGWFQSWTFDNILSWDYVSLKDVKRKVSRYVLRTMFDQNAFMKQKCLLPKKWSFETRGRKAYRVSPYGSPCTGCPVIGSPGTGCSTNCILPVKEFLETAKEEFEEKWKNPVKVS